MPYVIRNTLKKSAECTKRAYKAIAPRAHVEWSGMQRFCAAFHRLARSLFSCLSRARGMDQTLSWARTDPLKEKIAHGYLRGDDSGCQTRQSTPIRIHPITGGCYREKCEDKTRCLAQMLSKFACGKRLTKAKAAHEPFPSRTRNEFHLRHHETLESTSDWLE